MNVKTDRKPKVVLLIENSRYFIRAIGMQLSEIAGVEIATAQSLEEAMEVIENPDAEILVAVTNLNLEGSERGELLSTLKENDVPTVILTSHLGDDVRKEALQHENVIDYFLKERGCLQQVSILVRQLWRNQGMQVLLVDDSRSMRRIMRELLMHLRFTVIEAEHGAEAIEKMRTEPNIGLVVTDYEMPILDGLGLIKELRKRHAQEDLCIIGMTASDAPDATSRFIKQGANDLIHKPINRDEFFCRILQNLTMLDQVKQLKDAAYRDFLTRMFNRNYFFSQAPKIYKEAKGDGKPLVVVMMDIDHFKNINDTWGHDGGDAALVHLADMMRKHFRESDLPTRFGGEEFCILFHDLPPEKVYEKLEKFRLHLSQSPCHFAEAEIPLSISIGASAEPSETIDRMIRKADICLYNAKESGRNRVVTDWA